MVDHLRLPKALKRKGTFSDEEVKLRVGNCIHVDDTLCYTRYKFRINQTNYRSHAEYDGCDVEWLAIAGWRLTYRSGTNGGVLGSQSSGYLCARDG